jgi:hypothetical protein
MSDNEVSLPQTCSMPLVINRLFGLCRCQDREHFTTAKFSQVFDGSRVKLGVSLVINNRRCVLHKYLLSNTPFYTFLFGLLQSAGIVVCSTYPILGDKILKLAAIKWENLYRLDHVIPLMRFLYTI